MMSAPPAIPACRSKPAYFMAHDLHNKYTAVRRRRGVDAVNGVGGHIDGALKTKGHIGSV